MKINTAWNFSDVPMMKTYDKVSNWVHKASKQQNMRSVSNTEGQMKCDEF